MGETENIARMAEVLSEEIFSIFGWKKTGPVNLNWNCVTADHQKASHPSDVVFYYEEPYKNQRIYVNVDLKSFSSRSISKHAIGAALNSLIRSTECANISEEFLNRYTDSSVTSQIVGMLFVYNHDDQYSYDLHQLLETMDERNFDIVKNRRIFLIDPATVSYLYTVATDITSLRGRNEIPGQDECRFFYPDLVQVRARKSVGEAATLESLTGPWQILHYNRPVKVGSSKSDSDAAGDGYLVYYRGKGDEPRDFRYLIDHFFHYQMLGENSQIHLRMPGGFSLFRAGCRKLYRSLWNERISYPAWQDQTS